MKNKLKGFFDSIMSSDNREDPQSKIECPEQMGLSNSEIVRTTMEEPAQRLSMEDWPTDIILANDISGSMSEEDCKPSRLEASKKASIVFVEQLSQTSPQSRIAIISFNNSAKVVLPFTSVLTTEIITRRISSLYTDGGTNIPAALKAARALFEEDSSMQRNWKILLLTDGYGGDPLKQAKLLKEYDTHIEVIGVGGNPRAVNEKILRKVATTDEMGITHYRFINDSDVLVKHYRDIATGIVYRGNK